MAEGENIYIRGFGSFITKKRAAKIGRNIKKNIAVEIPEHYIPAFKPSKEFVQEIKERNINQNLNSLPLQPGLKKSPGILELIKRIILAAAGVILFIFFFYLEKRQLQKPDLPPAEPMPHRYLMFRLLLQRKNNNYLLRNFCMLPKLKIV